MDQKTERLLPDSQLKVITTLSLVVYLLSDFEFWFVTASVSALCVFGLLFQDNLFKSRFWAMLSIPLGVNITYYWYQVDNHEFLLFYWSLVLAFSFRVERPLDFLKTNARILFVLVFGLAAVWKLFSSNYMSGDFFIFALLTDGRFVRFTQFLPGVDLELIKSNMLAFESYAHLHETDQVNLKSSSSLKTVSIFLTWWTLIIEALCAFFFLTNKKYGHLFLILFLLSVYCVAPVVRYAWILTILGLTMTNASQIKTPSMLCVYLFSDFLF